MTLFYFIPIYYNGILLDDYDIKDNYLHGWCFLLQTVFCERVSNALPYKIFEKYDPNHTDTHSEYIEGEYWDNHVCMRLGNEYLDIQGIFSEDEYIKMYKSDPLHPNIIDCYLEKTTLSSYEGWPIEIIQLTEKVVDQILNQI